MSTENKSFETKLKELEAISQKLENPSLELDESIKLYKQAVLLSKELKEELEKVSSIIAQVEKN